MVFLDETEEALAGMLRPGNAGANNAFDHEVLLDQAISQFPDQWRLGHRPGDGADLVVHQVLVRSDSAGASHDFVDACAERNTEVSIGMAIDSRVREALLLAQEEDWERAIETNGELRDGAWVTEAHRAGRPLGLGRRLRLICRRERPHPGAQLSLFDTLEGFRHQCFLTTSEGDIAELELRHRGHARVEDRIRAAKDMGLRNLPFRDVVSNEAWVEIVLAAMDLVAWTKSLRLEGELRRAEPKRLRFALLHVAARVVRTGRQIVVRLQRSWPWADALAAAFKRIPAHGERDVTPLLSHLRDLPVDTTSAQLRTRQRRSRADRTRGTERCASFCRTGRSSRPAAPNRPR